MESLEQPEYTLSGPKPTKVDAYKQVVDEWLEEAPYSAVRILEKLREMGGVCEQSEKGSGRESGGAV